MKEESMPEAKASGVVRVEVEAALAAAVGQAVVKRATAEAASGAEATLELAAALGRGGARSPSRSWLLESRR